MLRLALSPLSRIPKKMRFFASGTERSNPLPPSSGESGANFHFPGSCSAPTGSDPKAGAISAMDRYE
jgi:hypothetical protein